MFLKEAFVLLAVVYTAWSCKRCCMPQKFEGYQGLSVGSVVGGKGHLTQGWQKISYDAEIRKIYAEGDYTTDGKTVHVVTLQDFKNNVQYRVIKGNCENTTLATSWTDPCVPEDAKCFGYSYYGSEEHPFYLESFYGKQEDLGYDYFITAHRDRDDNDDDNCIFVAESVTGSNQGVDFNMGTSFQNYTKGIQDMSVFEVPKACSSTKLKFVANGPLLFGKSILF